MIKLGDLLRQLAAATPAPAVPEEETTEQLLVEATALPADRQPAAVYLARLSPGSRPTMASTLEECARLLSAGRLRATQLPWHRVRYQHTAALRSVLMERYAPATATRMLSAVRGVLREAWRLRLVDSESYARAVDIRNVRADVLPRGRALEPGELVVLFRHCADDPTARGRRDAAVLALLYGCALRRAEVVALELEDYAPTSGELRVRSGKGRRDRVTYAPPGALDALADWLEVRGPAPGALIAPVKAGRVKLRQMRPWSLYELVLRRAQAAGVAPFTPHDCRRTYISELLDAGVDLAVIRALVGHQSIETTAKYDRRGEGAKLRAAALLPVPYIRPRARQRPQDGPQPTGEGLGSPGEGQSPDEHTSDRREGSADDSTASSVAHLGMRSA